MPITRLLLCLVFFTFGCQAGCTTQSAKPSGGAEKPKVEANLAFTDLLQDEYDKLKIKAQPARLEEVHERLTLTGWIMAKPGNEVTLTAPAAGYVKLKKDGKFPIAGDAVGNDHELLALTPVLSPAEKIQVDALRRSIESDRKKAESSVETAKKDHERILKLHGQMLKSDQELELALKAKKHAEEELDAARDKLKLFDMPNIPIKAPRAGTVLQVHVSPGQYVAAAAPLATIVDLDPVWIRVPVPESDLARVDGAARIEVMSKNLDADRDEPSSLERWPYHLATPTGRLTQVDPVRHAADLWYELDAKAAAGPKATPHRFLKDQMVSVRLKMDRKEMAAVAPYSAILFDTNGKTWIYVEQKDVKDGKHLFERRQVELTAAHRDGVVVTRGAGRPALADGELVVAHGAAVLFSREFFKTPLR